jgi:translation initiation factor IF-1
MTPEETKAIEEMAKVIETTEQIARDAHCGYPSPRMYAKDLYWKGYRKQEWISVDERLPEEDVRVLVWLKDDVQRYTHIDTDRRLHEIWVRWGGSVTHWMPLPEAPKMKGGVTAESAIRAVQEAALELKNTPPDNLLGIGSTMQF